MIVLIVPLISACSHNSRNEARGQALKTYSENIEVYYFHFTSRCATCRTVEAKTKENVETIYPQLFNDGLIKFSTENLDEEQSKVIGERLGVSGQTVLLVKGDKRINLTNEAFMYAVVKPEKYREIFKEKIDELSVR